MKLVVVKAVTIMVVVAVLGVFFFDGIGRQPYKRDELESEFLAKAAELGAEHNSTEATLSEEFGNSVTFLLETEDGERACGTYIRSLFSHKYKEYKYYFGVNGVLALDDFTYSVSDGAMIYQLNLKFGDNPSIEPGDEVAPLLYYKFAGLCAISMGVFGSRIFFRKKK